MSAYQYPAPASPYAAAAPADPTAVMGRRIAAWVIDFLLYALIMAFVSPTPLSPLAEYVDTNDNPGISCSDVQDLNDVSSCVEIGDRLYFTDDSDAAVQFLVVIAFVLLYSALQGATGVTPGKAAFGLKVVNEQGERPGFGKSLLRTVLWAVDLAPWCIPGLVGFITGLTTKGHRRVGDMAAKTFVVGKAHTGPIVVPGLTTAATGGYPGGPGAYGAPGQQWGGAPQGAPTGPPTAWGGPPQTQQQGAWGTPPGGAFPPGGASGPPASGPPVAGAPTPGGPGGTPSGESRPAPPTGGWAAPGGEAPAAGAPTAPSASPTTPTDRPGAPGAGSQSPAGATAPSDAGRASPPSTPSGTPPTPGSPTSGQASTSPGSPFTSGAAPASSAGAPQGGAAPAPGAGASGQAPQAAASGYNPQWDAARGTYIVWEPNRGKWLGWDERAQEWKPL